MQVSIEGYTLKDTLFQNARSFYIRGVRNQSQQAVLIKVLQQGYPSAEEIARIRNEFQLMNRLELPEIMPPLELVKHGNRLSLVMEQLGEPLSSLLDGGIQLTEFFIMAIEMAKALDIFHRKGLIHKAISPSTLFWDEDRQRLRVIEFENATELTQEQKNDPYLELFEENLPYISPEQTGRMNRDVDYLTDYYSLGATYYEMITGKKAFEAADTMGWVYCHLTKKPVELSKIKSEVPKIVSDIVLKLMSKNPENRYQSMQGLIKDLQECQRQWAQEGTIESLVLGKSDFSDKFQIPQKLYGRKAEIDALMGAFRNASRGQPELLMIAGFSGIGKSALVKEIRIPVLQADGFFIEGENDQLQRSQPYIALRKAFDGLIRRLLAEPNETLEGWKYSLLQALGTNAQIVLDIIPELERIIGPQPSVQSLNPTEAQNRFLLTFRKFFSVFATASHPLVLFLDDLQWTDVSTLDLISDLLRQDTLYLLVIGSYRNNEVSPTHPLMMALDEIQKFRFIKRIFLTPLKEEAVSQLLQDSLHSPAKTVAQLSELIFTKTNGNPFFVKELLKELHKEGHIWFDHGDGSWRWDLDQIRGLQVSDNVVRFVITRIKRLPRETQQILELASCIGNSFDLKTLGLISSMTLPTIAETLWEAINQGILIPMDDRYRLVQTQDRSDGADFSDFGVQYRFAHDRIQQAFYSLIHEDKQKEIHLSIGRVMHQRFSADEVEQRLVDILFQLNLSRSLISDKDERIELARLNLTAAKRAKASTAYQSTYDYLEAGRECLPENPFEQEYELAFEVVKEFSEAAYLCGEFREADEQCHVLLKHARTKMERAEVLRMQSLQYTIRGELEKAIDMGIEGLSILDIKLSPDPGRVTIAKEFLKAKINLGTRRIPELAEQPLLQDNRIRTQLKMLIELGAPAYLMGREQLFALTVLKGVNTILKHGNTPEAPMCYVPFGFLLGSVVGDWKSGYQFGKLGLELNEKLDNLELKSRVIFFYTVFIHAWNKPWKAIPGFLKKAIDAAYQSGDLFYLAYSAVQVIPWDPELDLEQAIKQGEKYLAIIKETKYDDAWYSAKIIQQLRLNFRGSTFEWLTLNSLSFDETEFFNRNKQVGFVPGIALYHLYKLQICYSYEDYKAAAYHAAKAEQPMGSVYGLPYTVEYCLYAFLAYIADFKNKVAKERTHAWKHANKQYAQMKKWAEHCPQNFSHHLYLMEAELARVAHRNQSAANLYNKAIAAAQTNGFLRYEALCNELTAKHFLSINQPKIAATYMKDALYCYNRWGAIAKSDQLRRDYPFLFSQQDLEERQTEHPITEGEAAEEGPPLKGTSVLDLNTISKASQTLSGEVVLEKLLKKLMYIVRENAGADKAILILKEEGSGEMLIQAESVGEEATVVMQSRPLEEIEHFSVSIVQYVARSLENVVLKDAARQGDFIHEPYISTYQPKSILCQPIINQGILVGVLYLENNLTTDAFTPERLSVLGVLSSQAAISIQNALLYRTMEQKVVERTREIKELLDNTGQGFLTFDEDFRVHKQYSKACEQFFGKELVDKTSNQEKGIDFLELIIGEPKERAQLKKLFEAILSEKVSLEAIDQFFPEEVEVGNRMLSLEYKLIEASQSGSKNRIMVILTDVTREKELAEQLEKDEERNRTILQIVKDRQGYMSFLKSFTSCFRNIEVILKKEPADIDVDRLFRLFHTIKGGAANFNLHQLADQAHDIESILYDVRAGEATLDIDLIFTIKRQAVQLEQDFRSLTADYGNFIPEEDTVYMESIYKVPQSKIARHREFLLERFGSEAFEEIESSIREICRQPIKTALRGFEISAQSLAKELGKRVNIETSGESIEILYDQLNHLLSCFIHLVRNAIDHGLESPEERVKVGKPEVGLLKIQVEKQNTRLRFVFEDDGQGMDADKIAAIALKEGIVDQAWLNKASKQDILNLVFAAGFSSKTDVSTLSGRGVGMDVVKAVAEELSGSVDLSTEPGQGTRITVTIPDD